MTTRGFGGPPEPWSQFFSKKAKNYQNLLKIAQNGQNYPKMPYIDLKMKKIKSNCLLKQIKDASANYHSSNKLFAIKAIS